MRIYSMTATFGKLEHQTLTLKPGLNVIQAPNEWGKSTWCAFLVAMLYGIDSRVHGTTKNALADKTRYDPWSGQLMSGRVELNWNGRDITLERSSTKRSQLRQFRAFETATGAPIPELTAENCGQVLLGVEKEVFQRAGFIRLTDMPVTQNESLRRRLNALVTTGDESGEADRLAGQLTKLKNEVRANRSHGLLPEAQSRKAEIEEKLLQLQQLQAQHQKLQQRQQELENYQLQLQNHRSALRYHAARENLQRLQNARDAEAAAMTAVQSLEAQCTALPDMDTAQKQVQLLRQLQQEQLSIQMEGQMYPLPPEPPVPPVGQPGSSPDQVDAAIATQQEENEIQRKQLKKKGFPLWIPGVLVLAAAAVLYFLSAVAFWCALAIGLLLILADLPRLLRNRRNKAKTQLLMTCYAPIDPALSRQYRQEYDAYQRRMTQLQTLRADLDSRARSLRERLLAQTGGRPLEECLRKAEQAVSLQQQLSDARREHMRAAALTQALQSVETAPKPTTEDTLTFSEADTNRLLSDCTDQLRQLHLKQGHCLGQMEALGSAEDMQPQLEAWNQRIRQLSTTLAALTLAQETLAEATVQLQRRFAPGICQRANELFGAMTGGRYDRLSLAEDLSVHVGAQGEDILRSALWRSEGTTDQLYLALRLAVAGELTPNAPLILDDALVRFDDDRLAAAMEILSREAEQKQVILFTCQSRETTALSQ